MAIPTCQQCGQSIGALKRSDSLFCSTRCRQRHHRLRQRQEPVRALDDPWATPFGMLTRRYCAGCGSWVLGHWINLGRLRADARYCSTRCRVAAHRARVST